MVRLVYFDHRSVDCTSDPHQVSYSTIKEMLADVLKVCESDLVHAVRSVALEFGDPDKGGERYESDRYNEDDYLKKGRMAAGEHAVKHKVAGLYFCGDAEVDAGHHLPPGLTGLKEAIKVINKRLEREEAFTSLVVGVIWRFAMQSSCSDYITATPASMDVDYSNQDWYVESENYGQHIAALSELLGAEIKPYGE